MREDASADVVEVVEVVEVVRVKCRSVGGG